MCYFESCISVKSGRSCKWDYSLSLYPIHGLAWTDRAPSTQDIWLLGRGNLWWSNVAHLRIWQTTHTSINAHRVLSNTHQVKYYKYFDTKSCVLVSSYNILLGISSYHIQIHCITLQRPMNVCKNASISCDLVIPYRPLASLMGCKAYSS